MSARLPSGGHVRTCACPSVAYRWRSSCDVLPSRCVSERLAQQGVDVVDDSFCLVPLARMDEPLVSVIERTVHGAPNVVVSHEPELAGHDVGATSCGQLVHIRVGKGMESTLAGVLAAQGVNGFVDEHGKAELLGQDRSDPHETERNHILSHERANLVVRCGGHGESTITEPGRKRV